MVSEKPGRSTSHSCLPPRSDPEIAQIPSGSAPAAGVEPETLDVSFIQPVNIYLKSERAVKYGILFIVLTFAAFLAFSGGLPALYAILYAVIR
jgi:inner membrane protein involved in colicin E2 resistance